MDVNVGPGPQVLRWSLSHLSASTGTWALEVALPALPPCTPDQGFNFQCVWVGGEGCWGEHPFLDSHSPWRLPSLEVGGLKGQGGLL